MTLATDYLGRPRHRPELLAEARLVGAEYGAETERLGLALADAIQAFVFFRNSLMEGLQETGAPDASAGAVYKTWQQVNTITDEVLQGIVRAYQGTFSSQIAALSQ